MGTTTIRRLQEDRVRLGRELKRILDHAARARRELTADEKQEYCRVEFVLDVHEAAAALHQRAANLFEEHAVHVAAYPERAELARQRAARERETTAREQDVADRARTGRRGQVTSRSAGTV